MNFNKKIIIFMFFFNIYIIELKSLSYQNTCIFLTYVSTIDTYIK